MCEAASFVVAKGPKAFWSKRTDSHTEIRKEHGMPENGIGAIVNVQVEITPAGNDYSLPLDKWTFRVDQDRLPTWWDAKEVEAECRLALVEWAKSRLVRHGEKRDVNDGENVIVCGGTVKACGSSTVTACGSSTVTACGSSTVTACGSSTVTAYDSSTVTACEYLATVSFYCKFACKLTGLFAVIIDRTQAKAKCYIGTGKTRTVKSKG